MNDLKITKRGISYRYFWIHWWAEGLPMIELVVPWFFSMFKGTNMKCITVFHFQIKRQYYFNYKEIDGTTYCTSTYTGLKGFEIVILGQRLLYEKNWELCGNWFKLSAEVAKSKLMMIFSILKLQKHISKEWVHIRSRRTVKQNSLNNPNEPMSVEESTAYYMDFMTGMPTADNLHLTEGMIEGDNARVSDENIRYFFNSGKIQGIRFSSFDAFNMFASRCRTLGYEIYTIEDYKDYCNKIKA